MVAIARFGQRIRALNKRIENETVAVRKRAANAYLTTVVNGTPVDKGVARSNWRVSINQRTFSVISAYSPGKNLGIGERSNRSAALAVGRSTINKLRKNQFLYITNNTPYIEIINEKNNQGSTGFLEEASDAAARALKTFRLRNAPISDDE